MGRTRRGVPCAIHLLVTLVYCINLATSTARRRRMEGRFRHHGLEGDVTFVDAVTPHSAEVAAMFSGSSLPETDLPVLACARSHLAALRMFLNTDAPAAIVMEDDVMLHNDFTARLHAMLANRPDDAGVISLGYLVWHWESSRWGGRSPELENLKQLDPDALWGTQGYWISREHAERMVAVLDRPAREWGTSAIVTSEVITRTSDGWVSYPPLLLEEVLESTIGRDHERRLASHRFAQGLFPVSHYTKAERAGRGTTIGLCMIVRDEAKVIERCLASVSHLIDHWVICDTGSVDGTPDVIAKALADVPGVLHHTEWRDFGHNRSELLRRARGTADYLLLLDADQTLHEVGPLPELTSDVYRLRHEGSVEYDVGRLVRGDLPFYFKGRTHEYLTCDEPTSHSLLASWRVVHFADGGARADKFERDRRLLQLSLDEDPDDERTVFYLAQTLDALGETDQAIALFNRRAEMGGFEEEAWFAQTRAATLLGRTDPAAAIGKLLACWERRPTRIEPLHEAAVLAEAQQWWRVMHTVTLPGLSVHSPDDILFVRRGLYDGALRTLHDRAAARLNIAGLSPVTSFEELAPDVRYARVELQPTLPWPTFNPSIAADPGTDGWALVVRAANYRLSGGRYYFVDDDGTPTRERVVRTRNWFVRLDESFQPVEVKEIVERSHRAVHRTGIHGLEDCRLQWWHNSWWVAATTRDANERGMARVSLARLHETDTEMQAVDFVEFPAQDPGRHEKNWAPFASRRAGSHDAASDGADPLHLIDRWHPYREVEWDGTTLSTAGAVSAADGDPRLSEWRGGSQGVRVGDAVLFIIHQVRYEAGIRRYLHRVVGKHDDGTVDWSAAFTFTGAPIEFAAGLAVRGDTAVISFGVGDAVAALAVLPLAQLVACLPSADQASPPAGHSSTI